MKTILSFSLLIALLSCSNPGDYKNVAHSDTLSVVSNALLGEWKSTREAGKKISFITSYPASKDSNILMLDNIGTQYFTLDSVRTKADLLQWKITLSLNDGGTDNIFIMKLTGDTLSLWEPNDFITGIYLRSK